MKRISISAAIVAGVVVAAALAPVSAAPIDVTGYTLPDPAAFNVVTTGPENYSYYTGPITLQTLNDGDIDVYCADLDHTLHNGQYAFGILDHDGRGNAISQEISNRLGQLAGLGLLALAANKLDIATAIQAAIWDTEYSVTSTFSDGPGGPLATLVAGYLSEAFTNDGTWAVALIPFGQGWSEAAGASQQMIVGTLIATPEPITLSILGVGLLGLGVARRRI